MKNKILASAIMAAAIISAGGIALAHGPETRQGKTGAGHVHGTGMDASGTAIHGHLHRNDCGDGKKSCAANGPQKDEGGK